MRKLASIQKIKSLKPIEGADKIEVARILGWDVVVRKDDNFKVGDLVVYCEIDSIMPDRPEFEFLKNTKGKMLKIRTVKFRGQISQGIAFPMSVLPDHAYEYKIDFEGTDVTEFLGVIKYEPPLPKKLHSGSVITYPRPSFVPKTDETRVQVLEGILEYYENALGFETEKLDGSSCSVYYNHGKTGVCSRNTKCRDPFRWWCKSLILKGLAWFYNKVVRKRLKKWFRIRLQAIDIPVPNAFYLAVKEQDIISKLKRLGENIVLQGEVIGEGIQGNPYKIEGYQFRCFQIWSIDARRYWDIHEWRTFCRLHNIAMVPIINQYSILVNCVDTYVKKAIGHSLINPEVQREGIVWRPFNEIMVPIEVKNSNLLHNRRLSFKSVNKEYLLTEKSENE